MFAGTLTKLGPALLTEDAMMRTLYENATKEWDWPNIAPQELAIEVAKLCQQIADTELAVQGKQHTALYEHEIALLKAEIISLNAEIGTLNKQRSSRSYVE